MSEEKNPTAAQDSALKKVGGMVVRGGIKGLLHTQFGRFLLVGGLNTLVDLLVLNILIISFQTDSQDNWTVLFKAIAFLVAMANSYILNKLWTFQAKAGSTKKEAMPFFIVSMVGFLLNVGAFKLFMQFVLPPADFLKFLWPSVGALVGTAAGLGWNFIGYKTIVFRKPAPVDAPKAENEPQKEDSVGSMAPSN